MKKPKIKDLPPKEELLALIDDIVEAKEAEAPYTMTAIVSARGLGSEGWEDKAGLVSLSATGASFTIPKECTVGRLVSLKAPLAAHLRCYDLDKELYSVWGLVQYCHKSRKGGKVAYLVGVAFTGQEAPASYRQNPLQNYRVTGVSEDGLWEITESNGFKVRRDMRYARAVELYLSRVDARMQSIGGERTVTENISRTGAAVVSSVDVGTGERVKFICERYDFSSLAVVCNKQEIEGSKFRLHLKFVGAVFPVEKIRPREERAEKATSRT